MYINSGVNKILFIIMRNFLKGFEELGFQIDSSTGGGSGDFAEATRDGRTYLATRNLPNGIMAFLAVTNNDGDEIWKPQTTCL